MLLPTLPVQKKKTVLIREVSLFQRLIYTQKYAIGTSETVLIREVSFKRGSTVYLRASSSFFPLSDN